MHIIMQDIQMKAWALMVPLQNFHIHFVFSYRRTVPYASNPGVKIFLGFILFMLVVNLVMTVSKVVSYYRKKND